jgi:drug/metabolite transporter (DMT)-like permease
MKRRWAFAFVIVIVVVGVVVGVLAGMLTDVLTDVTGSLIGKLLAAASIGISISALFHLPGHGRTFYDYYYEAISSIEDPDNSIHTERTGLGIVALVFSVPLVIFIFVSSAIVDVFASDSLVWSALASTISAVTIGCIDRLIIDDGNE